MISVSSLIFILTACSMVYLIFFVRRNIRVRVIKIMLGPLTRLFRKARVSLSGRTSAWAWYSGESSCSVSSTLLLNRGSAIIVVAVLSVISNECSSNTSPPSQMEVGTWAWGQMLISLLNESGWGVHVNCQVWIWKPCWKLLSYSFAGWFNI